MERVETLCNKLQEQLAQKASPDQLLLTVEMLQSELMHLKLIQPKKETTSPVAVNIAASQDPAPARREETPPPVQEKTVEILQVDEAELEAELEEIKKNAQAKNNLGAQHKPTLLFDPIEDIPTLTHQQPPVQEEKPAEVHQAISKGNKDSLNDQLKQPKLELGDSLQEVPIKDLKKAIGINDKFLFINELFRGDVIMYERSIKTINSFAIYAEAEYWIKRELKLKLGWNDRNHVVQQFDQLIKRRFL
jgi:hypothetical protein